MGGNLILPVHGVRSHVHNVSVIYSLYKIQIRDGATYRQYAAEQQLLDSTIQATRGEIYDTSGITLASTSVVWTIWADPSYSTALYTTTTDQDTKAECILCFARRQPYASVCFGTHCSRHGQTRL